MPRFHGDNLLFNTTIRVGRHRKPIKIRKLRSMPPGAHRDYERVYPAEKGRVRGRNYSVDDPRVTRFGRFLRKYHLDELPQMWDVLTGKLRPVGFRPVPRQIYRSLPEDVRRMYDEMGPGLAGIEYACRPFPPTEEALIGEYRRFYAAWKKSPGGRMPPMLRASPPTNCFAGRIPVE